MAGALDGLVVLDLTTHLSGPFCGMQLADIGADVIKIESPQGDSMRGAPPFVEGEGAPFMLWNRNKRGIVLDLKAADDLAIFWDLVDGADVVLENFRPGVIDRLGIGWKALHARNPRLILGSISGFGQTGPYAKRGGFDLVIQAMSGLMSVTGPKDGPPLPHPARRSPMSAPASISRSACCRRLQARHKTRRGPVGRDLAARGHGVARRLRGRQLFRHRRAAGEARPGPSRLLALPGVPDQRRLASRSARRSRISSRKVCALIGKPELVDDPRFKTNALRVKNNDEIVAILQAEIAKRTTADWMTALEAEGIPAGPVLYHDEVFADPQILARGMVGEVEHAKAGKQKTLGVPIKMSATPGGLRRAAPTLGQHDAELKKTKIEGRETMVRTAGVSRSARVDAGRGGGAERLQLHRRRRSRRCTTAWRRPRPRCPAPAVAHLAWASMTILSARTVPAADGVPEHCRVSGLIAPEVRFELNLPANWNRRFYMHGNGGFAGESAGVRPAADGARQCAEAGLRDGPDQHRPRCHRRAARHASPPTTPSASTTPSAPCT